MLAYPTHWAFKWELSPSFTWDKPLMRSGRLVHQHIVKPFFIRNYLIIAVKVNSRQQSHLQLRYQVNVTTLFCLVQSNECLGFNPDSQENVGLPHQKSFSNISDWLELRVIHFDRSSFKQTNAYKVQSGK